MYILNDWIHRGSERMHHSSFTDLLIGAVVAVVLGIALAMTSEITKPIFFN
jgi:hypothetical protein